MMSDEIVEERNAIYEYYIKKSHIMLATTCCYTYTGNSRIDEIIKTIRFDVEIVKVTWSVISNQY